MLDSVRAAQQVAKAGANSRFAVWGHSQGGHAALFAGQLAKSYAPDLTLVGVAAIAPATELEQLLKDDQDERAGKIIVSYCLWSWSRVYGTPLEDWVPPTAVVPAIDRDRRRLRRDGGRGVSLRWSRPSPIPSNYLSPDVYTNEKWHRLFVENRPGGAAGRRAALRRAGDWTTRSCGPP